MLQPLIGGLELKLERRGSGSGTARESVYRRGAACIKKLFTL